MVLQNSEQSLSKVQVVHFKSLGLSYRMDEGVKNEKKPMFIIMHKINALMTYTLQCYGYLYVILMCGHRRGRDAFLAINTPCQSADATSICQKLKYPRQISDTCFRSRTKTRVIH